jgi:DNA-binding SARP family transcriptional activator
MSLCSTCLDSLSEAVNLYHNDFLAGFALSDTAAFDEWQFFQGESLRQALVSALERLVSFHTAQGDYEAAIPLTRRRLALDSLHEPAHRQLMQLYEQTGQLAAALRQYELCVDTLAGRRDAAGVGAGRSLDRFSLTGRYCRRDQTKS